MNTFFTLASPFNIDYIFNDKLKKFFVILKCLTHIIFCILGLLKKNYIFWYIIVLTVIQIGHFHYDKGAYSIFYYFDPIYLLSTPFLHEFMSYYKVILVQMFKIFFGLYLYARIQIENKFYCYQNKPISEWYHGVCPSPDETAPGSHPICSYENCIIQPNIRPFISHILTYILFLLSVGVIFSIAQLRRQNVKTQIRSSYRKT